MRKIDTRMCATVLQEMSDMELDFFEQYRKTETYRDRLAQWQAEVTYSIAHVREVTDGRNVLRIEALHGARVVSSVIIEASVIDSFVERLLEMAERVRAAEQERAAEIKG